MLKDSVWLGPFFAAVLDLLEEFPGECGEVGIRDGAGVLRAL